MPPKILKIIKLVVALIVLEITSVIGVGSIFDVPAAKAALMSAGMAIVTVSGALALAYIQDGKLTDDEIQGAFTEVAKRKSK